jgi:iron complex transport system substrate-binding protein
MPHRIVSLIASATEIVAALGFEDQLVGRSHECDHPRSVERLPVCSEPKIDVNGTSRQIDERVKTLLRDALSVYRVFPDVLQQLEPTHIITQTQCEVCAVSLRDVEEAVCQIIGSQPRIVSLEPMKLADIWTDIRSVAVALGAPSRADELIDRLQARLDEIAARAACLPRKTRVASIEWIEPLMCAGNWVPELIEIAGGEEVLGQAGKHSPYMAWDQLREADPDAIVLLPCGFDIDRTRREMPPLVAHPGWRDLRAVRESRVFLTDGNAYFNRPGPRLVESAEIFAEMLHPEAFHFGHEGRGWERWTESSRRSELSPTR